MALKEYKDEPARTGHLTFWDALETPTILRLKDGGLLATIRYRGPDLHSAPTSALITQATRLNNLYKRFGGGWSLLIEARRRTVHTYPRAEWPDPVSRLLDAKRREHFTRGNHYTTDTYLTLVSRVKKALAPGWKHLVYANLPQERSDEDIATFDEEIHRTYSLLAECCATNPETGEKDITRLEGSALLTYLRSTVTFQEGLVSVPELPYFLDTTLATGDLWRRYRFPSLWRWPHLDGRWLRCISVKTYPNETHPGMLDALERLPLEYRATTRYLPLDQKKAVQQLRQYRRTHFGQRITAGQALMEKMTGEASALQEQAAHDHEQEASAAQAAVEHNQVSFGYLTQTALVWDEDFAEATAKAQLIEEALNTAGLTAKIETVNTMAAWEGSIPGNSYANVRRPLLTSRNLGHLAKVTSSEQGKAWNPHLQAPALLLATGRGHVPFWLNHHVGDVGHFQVIGPVGMGKSTLLALMAMQWRKYGGQVIAFDKGGSLQCATYAVGGHWHDMEQELTQQFARGGTLNDLLGQSQRWALAPGTWHCFEFEGLLKTPALASETFKAIYNEVLPRLTGIPTLLLLDEGYIYLRHNPAFVQDALKDLRKKETSVGFFAQSIGDYSKSPIAHDINEQCLTRIFLSNYRAIEPETAKLYEGLGLNERQREIIAHLTPKRDYYYQGYANQGDQVFTLDLSPTELAFVGRSRPKDRERMADLYQGDGVQFGMDWLHDQGLHQDADALKSEGVLV